MEDAWDCKWAKVYFDLVIALELRHSEFVIFALPAFFAAKLLLNS